jgi:hypothetical protein
MSVRRPSFAVLCRRCRDLILLLVDVSKAHKNGTDHLKWWNETYGKTRSIQNIAIQECELCRILRQTFVKTSGFSSSDTRINISNRTFATYKGLDHSTCLFEALEASLALAPVLPVVQTDEGEDINAFTGRLVLQLADPLLVRDWLKQCEQHINCSVELSFQDFDFPFRLIDVQKGSIVEAIGNCRYVTLSYVWGNVKQVMLNKVTQKFLEQAGSITVQGLRSPGDKYTDLKKALEGRVIPRTIREAILLCQFLGERYLWTDSLCICRMMNFKIKLERGQIPISCHRYRKWTSFTVLQCLPSSQHPEKIQMRDFLVSI